MIRKILLGLGVCMSLTACQTISGGGNDIYSPAELSKNLKVGVTTSEEVRGIYGKPNQTSSGPTGPDLWVYRVDEGANSLIDQAISFLPIGGVSTVAGTMQENRSLFVHFENNRVSSYAITNHNPK